jgi:hypothetical protein
MLPAGKPKAFGVRLAADSSFIAVFLGSARDALKKTTKWATSLGKG